MNEQLRPAAVVSDDLAQKFKTTYEQLTCVSYSPRLDRLEATFVVKLPTGYSGGS